MLQRFFPVLFILVPSIMNAQNKAAFNNKYPTTKTVDQKDDYFGTSVSDPYRWLEDDRSSETEAWVKSQNTITQNYLSKIPFRKAIRERLGVLYNFQKFTLPHKEGSYVYFSKNEGLQNQFVLYRQLESKPPEVFLDPNSFSKDGTTSLQEIDYTKDGSICAYQISEGGSDWRKAIILNTSTKKQIDDTLYDLKFGSIAWRGNTGFYYSSYDRPKGASVLSAKTSIHKLYFHRLGTPQSSDNLIFGGEQTPRRYIGGYVTEDQNFLVITAANATYGNELYLQNLTNEKSPIVPLVTGFEHEQEIIYAKNGRVWILSNLNAPNKRLVSTDAGAPDVKNWKDVIPQGKFPLSVSTCGEKIFAQYTENAVSRIYQYDLEGHLEHEIKLPGLGTAAGFSGKKEEKECYYTYTSYITPTTIYKYDIATGKSSVYKKPDIKFDEAKYESKQVFYSSKDGTEIPMIITYKKGMIKNGKNALMLYGYGGFSISITPSFSISNLVFLENGGIYAVANLRGGGEFGDSWHDAGIKMKKQNVFDDFIAAAEYLIKEKYTSKEFLAISGRSNGGLLIGACMTQRPDLFRVAFPGVGVLDMLRYNAFTAGAGWGYDYGTAQDSKEMFEYLYNYSPVHNVKQGVCYPSTLITTADHDDRVVPAHSFKFASALQAKQVCTNPVLISIETKAGHGAGRPTGMILDESADMWAFMLWNMGINYNPSH